MRWTSMAARNAISWSTSHALISVRLRAWSDGAGVNLIIDLVGGAYVPAGIAALAPRGRLVLVGLVAGGDATVSLREILSKRLTIRGTALRSRT